ncbi:glutamate--cysteine ligase [Rhodococcus artemisiae]|uniref:Putative glutamate--cysteine ligase 2 n=1 Tax=Rhodococcus artemisiae TaxID=714159 RepID=A0ABU7L824_9NOCA|nr:glutamate--cysteine ligase [Rhodococcus artemisiae]MEE2057686.1 glutamate--cysteine ligase [Rhodococcus artemisiae]
MPGHSPRKVGVEEEFHLVDLKTRRRASRAPELLVRLPDEVRVGELQRCVVEVNSGVYTDLAELRSDLDRHRKLLAAAGSALGVGVVAAGAVPLALPTEMEVAGSPRSQRMLADYQQLAREQLTCGAQVHVDLENRDDAVRVATRIAPYLPVLLALSASSPFSADGADSGYASVRSLLWRRWPSSGPAAPASSSAEYDSMVDDLVSSGVIADPGMAYFDVRPSVKSPTLELRVCDSCPQLDTVLLVAALFRALVEREVTGLHTGTEGVEIAPTLTRAALWRAGRSGLEADLVDVTVPEPRPAADIVDHLVRSLRPQLEDAGDWALVSELAADAMARGTSAARQRRALDRRGRLPDVVDLLLAETVGHETSLSDTERMIRTGSRRVTGQQHRNRHGRPPHPIGPPSIDEQQLIAWRRDLHANPELSFEEHRTTDVVRRHLIGLGLAPVILAGGTGLWCDVGPPTGEAVALRADLDALPIAEATGLPYASTFPGVSHACGHDAHTTMLMGAATVLAATTPPHRVRLIFQPGEETSPGGSLNAIESGALEGVSRIFALHCDPQLEVGSLATRTGPITSSSASVTVRLWSAGGHTARPHLTGDLIHATAVLVTGLASVLDRRIDARTATVLTWGKVDAGKVGNSVPEAGELVGTLRSASRETWATLEPMVERTIGELLAPYDVRYELAYQQGVPPVVNDQDCSAELREAIASAVGLDNLAEAQQSSGGEDFAWYLEHVPGALGRLGVWDGTNDPHELHQPDFDLDERALLHGVRTFVALARGNG